MAKPSKTKRDAAKTYVIKTVAGTTLLHGSSKVLVQLGEDRFFERDAGTLHAGEMVLWEKEFTQADFDDSFLLHSERYRKARTEIHLAHPEDPERMVPRLRAFLLQGLQEQEVIHAPDLENRIFMDAGNYDDFPRPVYRDMEQYLHSLLQEKGQTEAEKVSTSAINKWLRGEVLAPRAWGVFDALTTVNPEFETIAKSFDQDHGFHFSYLVYVILRRSVAAYFAKPRQPEDKEDEPEVKYTPRGHLTVKPEVEMILGQFFGNTIDRKFQPVRVVSVKEVPPYRHDSPRDKTVIDPHLRRGVYTVKTGDRPSITIKNLRTLFEDYRTLERVFLETMGVYLVRQYGKSKTNQEAAVMYASVHEVACRILPPHETTDYFFRDGVGRLCRTNFGLLPDKAKVEEKAEQVLASIENGEIDQTLGFERLATARFTALLHRLNGQLPNGFRMWLMYRAKGADAEFEGKNKTVKHYQDMAHAAYDRFVRSNGIPRNYQGFIDTMMAVQTTGNRSEEFARRIQERLEAGIRQGIYTSYTREHLQRVLTEYDFPQFEQHALVVDEKLDPHHPTLGVTQINFDR